MLNIKGSESIEILKLVVCKLTKKHSVDKNVKEDFKNTIIEAAGKDPKKEIGNLVKVIDFQIAFF